jgi:transcription-repair coupling factor (superfamily II helicase)
MLTPQSEKRLQALKESVELGSGYKIAMRDLEIRGTGNILGKEQSGHVITIGLHLYSKLIAEAKKQLVTNNQAVINNNNENPLPILNLDIKSGLTNEYIKEDKMKFELYRQLSICEQIKDVEKVKNNIIDRFGIMNQEANNLILNTKIQILSSNININFVNKNKNNLTIRFNNQIGSAKNILLKSFNDATITRSNEIKIKLVDKNKWPDEIINIMNKIEEIQNMHITI